MAPAPNAATVHHYTQKHGLFSHRRRLKRWYDHFIYIAVILGPLVNIPQLYAIYYYQNASGVSFTSWASFVVLTTIWFGYGIIHREKPIIIMNFFLAGIQFFIAVGALVYG